MKVTNKQYQMLKNIRQYFTNCSYQQVKAITVTDFSDEEFDNNIKDIFVTLETYDPHFDNMFHHCYQFFIGKQGKMWHYVRSKKGTTYKQYLEYIPTMLLKCELY